VFPKVLETNPFLMEHLPKADEAYYVHFEVPQDFVAYVRLLTDDWTTDDQLWIIAAFIRDIREVLAKEEVCDRAHFLKSVEEKVYCLDKGWR